MDLLSNDIADISKASTIKKLHQVGVNFQLPRLSG